MFTQNDHTPDPPRRRRGRPAGRTARGHATRQRLYEAALRQFAAQGYAATTLRGIAREAEVSPGLLYRYFPSKLAVVMALYGDLSARFHTTELPSTGWSARCWAAAEASLEVLRPHRAVLVEVLPIMLADRDAGLLAAASSPSRERVLGVFVAAVVDSPTPPGAPRAWGRVAYVAHLALVLLWLLDRSEGQRASRGLMAWAAPVVRRAGWLARLPGASASVRRVEALVSEALFPPERAG